MKLTMLGTGHALTTEYYNSCFILDENGNYIMVDGGGGSGLLTRLKGAGYQWKDIKTVFVTDASLNHMLGILYVMDLVTKACVEDSYLGELTIYGGKEVVNTIRDVAKNAFPKRQAAFLGKKVNFIAMKSGDARRINGHYVTFFDTGSRDRQRYGLTITLDGDKRLTYLGEAPFNPMEEDYAINATWLIHQAYCLDRDSGVYNPRQLGLSTVKEAAQNAENLKVQNLILLNSEDDHVQERRGLYEEEAELYFHGTVYVPEDLESIKI